MNYENIGCYELHQLHAIDLNASILWVHHIQLPLASPTVINLDPFMCIMNVLNSHLFHAGKGRAQALRSCKNWKAEQQQQAN